jgi:hypothetical protein
MGPIGCLEKSVRNYHYLLRNNTEEHNSHLLCEGNLKSRIAQVFLGGGNKFEIMLPCISVDLKTKYE